MELYPLSDSLPLEPTVVTVGTFDGVHLGHQKIITRLLEIAKREGKKTCILTFFPHPRMVLKPDSNIQLLQTIEERKNELKQLGIDHVVILKFNEQFSELTAEEYIKQFLLDQLKMSYMIIGYDHKFGKNRGAGIEELKYWGKKLNFDVEEISAKDIDEVSVSSTKIRNHLLNGEVEKASAFLGHPYYINGIVVKGEGIGKDLGFPTANIEVTESYKLIPSMGVYAVRVVISETLYPGMLNIGFNPTFKDRSKSIEVNIFNFNRDIYGEPIKVLFVKWMRDELKFATVEDLTNQLKKDKESALKLL
ncbi:bifunctional riboflavin kinase/FAD synthetase [Aegicerativicinus sediminis]|uniref:bifunctional riboflavin kinase/FAD synthetase n=1 Tax=Aegicerativicinus sediminis TaxID=2893202 RepID=UPI001E52B7C3|nr:bifunctional riboflavin kinase/FAD synthetase [Aegicerativicinus sediminis]